MYSYIGTGESFYYFTGNFFYVIRERAAVCVAQSKAVRTAAQSRAQTFERVAVAVEDKDGNVVPKIKISENVGKITTPHFKKLYRFYGRDTGKAIADYLCVYDETVDDSDKMTIFDPEATWKRKEVYHFEARELLVPIFKNGELVYKQPSLEEIRAYCAAQVDTLWDEVKRFDNPHRYYVDLSQKLYDIKQELLTKNGSH